MRDPVRDPVAGARLDQPDRDRFRDQPQRLHRRRARLDAVHARDLGDVRRRRQQRRPQGPLQPGRRDLRRGAVPERGRGRRGPAHRDLRLQPRGLVRRRGPALREPVRQAPRDPGQLAHRAHRGRPLPGRRQRPLRRRHLRAPRARALEARQGGPARQRRRGDLKLDHTSRDQHLRPRGRAGGRGQRRGRHRDRQVEEARPLPGAPGHLRQPLHLRRARRGLRGLSGAEGEQALGQGLRAGHPRRRGARPSRRPPAARSTTSGPPRARPATTRPPRSPTSASGPPPQEPTRSPARSTPRTPASASTPTRSAATTRPAPGSPASSTSCSRRGCPATSSSRAISPT